jgi:hypothetical protein
MNILITDIDGVYNSHNNLPNGYCTIVPTYMELLNKIVAETKCKIVISSAWRYLIQDAVMTVLGFERMLNCFGLTYTSTPTIVGITRHDSQKGEPRWAQINDWLIDNPGVSSYCVVDDLSADEMGIPHDKRKRFVRTNSKFGMTSYNMMQIINILNSK